jgi:hypothetical protein
MPVAECVEKAFNCSAGYLRGYFSTKIAFYYFAKKACSLLINEASRVPYTI